MRPISISVKNYKSYGDNEITISLEDNIARLFVGKNGSGKTTFIDAIIWCIYGRSLCAVDEIVNRKTKKNCKVEFIFKIQNDIFSIIRYRKHDKYKNKILIFKNDKNISPIKTKEAQDLIYNIIGLTYDAMISCVIFSSELYSSFMKARGSDRLRVFENILSMKIINKWSDTTKLLRKPIIENIELLENKKEKIEVGIETLNKNLKDYKEKVKTNLNNLKEERELLLEEVESIKAAINELKEIDHISELEISTEYDRIIKQNEEIDKEIKSENEKIHDINDLLIEIETLKAKLFIWKNVNIEKELDKIKKYEEIKSFNENIKRQVLEIKNKITNSQLISDKIDFNIEKQNKIIHELENIQINKCPTCNQKISNEKMTSLEKRKKEEYKKYKIELKKLEKQLKEVDNNNKIFEEQIKKLKEQIKKIPINSEFKEEKLRNVAKKISEIKTKISSLKIEIKHKDNYNTEIENRIKDLKNKKIKKSINKPKYTIELLKNLKNEIEKEESNLLDINERLKIVDEKAKSSYNKLYVEDIKKKINILKKSLENKNEDISKNKNEDIYYDFLLMLFSNRDSGIKKKIIGKMINLFNREINCYLPLFFDYEVELSFDQNLIELLKVNDEKVSFDTFSSGEKARLEFAVTFSLFMLVKSFFSSFIGFIVFDEVLDGALDKDGLKLIFNVVDNLSENNSIIIISHNENLKEYFKNHIIIDRDNRGFSCVKGV